MHEFDQTTRDLYASRPNGRGDMTRPPAAPIGLKVEEAMTSADINAVWGDRVTPNIANIRISVLPLWV